MTSESTIHAAIIDWLRVALPRAMVMHIPNNPRSAIAGAKAKRLGMLAGAADILIVNDECMAFIEVKNERGRQSPAQKAFQQKCVEHGIPYAVVRGIADVEAFLLDIGMPLQARLAA